MKTVADEAVDAGRTKVTAYHRRRLLKKYDRFVGDAFAVIPDTKAKRDANTWDKKAYNLAVAFRDHKPEITRFLTDLNVPLTNNAAERDLRKVKLHKKISGHHRSEQGARRHARLRSYITTLAKHGNPITVIDAIKQLFADNAWLPPPHPT